MILTSRYVIKNFYSTIIVIYFFFSRDKLIDSFQNIAHRNKGICVFYASEFIMKFISSVEDIAVERISRVSYEDKTRRNFMNEQRLNQGQRLIVR